MDDLVISVCRVRSLVFPGMPFAVVGRFMESPATAAVALLATGIGWTVMAIYPVVAQSLVGEPEDVNGAAWAFAATFRWLLPVTVVICAWAIGRYGLASVVSGFPKPSPSIVNQAPE